MDLPRSLSWICRAMSLPQPQSLQRYGTDPATITNVAFRRLCRQYGAGLHVCEMITTRALASVRAPHT